MGSAVIHNRATYATFAPRRFESFLKSVDSGLNRIARRRLLTCLLIVALCLIGRLSLLKVFPKPLPRIHDEWAYVLGAETFAAGRLANPPHPLWRFFETIHENMLPTYVSKYPPAQSLFLAFGLRFFGNVWYGVLIGVALMCGAFCWMLQGWLPPRYALLGGLLAVLQFGFAHYWMNSYWGGGVAALGGALVIGAVPRLARRARASTACAAAIGVAILVNSRPYEGLAVIVLCSAALLWWTRGRYRAWLRPAVVLPFVVITIATAAGMADYNLKTTGSVTTLPYSINQHRYAASPLMWIEGRYPPQHREYRDIWMRKYWEGQDVQRYESVHHNPILVIFRAYAAFTVLLGYDAGLAVLLLILFGIAAAKSLRARIALGILALSFMAILPEKYPFAHYMAPMTGALFLVAMFGLRFLRCQALARHRTGRVLVVSLFAFVLLLFVFNTAYNVYGRMQNPESGGPIVFRRQVDRKLAATPGKHLVLVRYSPTHNLDEELVYNGPDIDAQKTVWALDFGPEADRPLLDYYRGRDVWLVQPDGPSPTLEPYSGN